MVVLDIGPWVTDLTLRPRTRGKERRAQGGHLDISLFLLATKLGAGSAKFGQTIHLIVPPLPDSWNADHGPSLRVALMTE